MSAGTIWTAGIVAGGLVFIIGIVIVFKLRDGGDDSVKLPGGIEIKSKTPGMALAILGLVGVGYSGLQLAETAALVVGDVSLSTDATEYHVACPVGVRFEGRIDTTGGPGTVAYQFVRREGAAGVEQPQAVQRVQVDGAGTITVADQWDVTIPEGTVGATEYLRVLEPSTRESNPISVMVTCDPTLPPGPPVPPPSISPPSS